MGRRLITVTRSLDQRGGGRYARGASLQLGGEMSYKTVKDLNIAPSFVAYPLNCQVEWIICA